MILCLAFRSNFIVINSNHKSIISIGSLEKQKKDHENLIFQIFLWPLVNFLGFLPQSYTFSMPLDNREADENVVKNEKKTDSGDWQ